MELFRHLMGEGPPLIILHGLFGISDNWVSIGKELSAHHKVIIPDLRNHGRSPHSTAFSYNVMRDDLLELYSDLSIRRAHILGHSMGGKLAMDFALNYPDMVEKLVVVDISPAKTRARQAHFKIMSAMKSIDFDCCSSREMIEEEIAGAIGSRKLRLFILKNLVRITPDRFAWRLNLDAIELNIDEIMEGVESDIPFENPTLFIRGGDSDYITDDDLPGIKTLFPNNQLVTIPGAGHWVHAERPAELLESLEWLNKQASP